MSTWQRLGGLSFCKQPIYSDLDAAFSSPDKLSSLLAFGGVAAAPFGGPLALLDVPDDSDPLLQGSQGGQLRDMCGTTLGQLRINATTPLAPGGLGWVDRVAGFGEELCVTVYVTGAVFAVTAHGMNPAQELRRRRRPRTENPKTKNSKSNISKAKDSASSNPFSSDSKDESGSSGVRGEILGELDRENFGLSEEDLGARVMNLALEEGDEHDGFVVQACVFGEGVAAVLRSGKVVVALGGDPGKVHVLNEGRPMSAGAALARVDVAAMTVVVDRVQMQQKNVRLGAVQVVVAMASGVVFVVSMKDAERKHVGEQHVHKEGEGKVETTNAKSNSTNSPARSPTTLDRDFVLRASAAPNGKYIAFFSRNGCLTVMSSDFSTTFLEFDTKAGIAPAQMCWCGSDAVVMQWNELGLLVVGPYGDWIKYTYSEPVVIVQEIDALRIISSREIEILQRVSPSTEAVGRIGSFEPAAMLCDVTEAMDNNDKSAADGMKALKEDGLLIKAITDCIEAAKAEFDVSRQEQLLRAASLGKSFCDGDSERRECSSAFVLACNALRVLNIVRHSSVALPLTMQQFMFMGAPRLAFRLAGRRMHLLALKVSSYLGLNASVKQAILVDWACAKLKADLPATAIVPQNPAQIAEPSFTRTPSSISQSSQTLAKSSAIAASLSRQIYTAPEHNPASTSTHSSLLRSHSSAHATPSSNGTTLRSLTPPLPPSPLIGQGGSATVAASAAAAGGENEGDQASVIANDAESQVDLSGELGPGLLSQRILTSPWRAEQERNLVDLLLARLAPVRGIPYARLSRMAAASGKTYAAILLARQEPVSIRRTVQLLELEDYREAFKYAVHSYDPNIILFAALYTWPGSQSPLRHDPKDSGEGESAAARVASRSSYLELIRRFPLVRAALAQFCEASGDLAMLKDLYTYTVHPARLARVHIKEAFACDSLKPRLAKMAVAVESYQRDRYGSFYARATNEHIRLLSIQRELESNTGQSYFVDNSLADTIYNCLVLHLDEKAREIKEEFKMSDRNFAHIQIRAHAQLLEWSKLRAMASHKRLAAPLLDFVTACAEADNLEEARHFAQMIKDDQERLEAFVKTKSWENAISVAVSLKDTTTLQLIRNNCNDEELKMSILQQVRNINNAGP